MKLISAVASTLAVGVVKGDGGAMLVGVGVGTVMIASGMTRTDALV
jgi:hypothetical protein